MLKQTGGDLDKTAQMEKDYQLNKLLTGKCEEEQKIDAAKKRWALVKKKKKILI
jgi:hypothetical protein